MRADTELGQAYSQLLQLARELSAAGHHEASYHSLMAALHCAEDGEDRARLSELVKLFRQQGRLVDGVEPPHKLSTRSAHGTRSIFEMGACMGEAVIKRLENQRRMDELRSGA
ncbi:MAG TPA: hypothetical protein VKE40_15945 [Gemmataceae bacterium]|nr:hypothetical protein [Gemmataceae bacterium]